MAAAGTHEPLLLTFDEIEELRAMFLDSALTEESTQLFVRHAVLRRLATADVRDHGNGS